MVSARFVSAAIKRPSNDVSAGLMGAPVVMGAGFNLSGEGEIICVCDTGLDTGDPATIHPDFAGRIVAIQSFPITPDFAPFINNPGANDGASDRDSGHGTHVAGSVLGDGTGSAGARRARRTDPRTRPQARLVFQAVEQEIDWKNPADEQRYGRFLLAGIPADLAVLLQDAYTRGARIHSNSWGGGDPGAYDAQCEQLDRFVWQHKDMCVLFAAGNDGTDKDGDGAINPMSVTLSRHGEELHHGRRQRERAAGVRRGNLRRVVAERLSRLRRSRTAPMADDPGQIVAFSSRGPTADGRFKPDVVAPGTFILSTRSTRIALNNKAWAAFPPSRLYFHMGGTSMATPLDGGRRWTASAVRCGKKRVAGGPTAALLKALLIASTVRLAYAGPKRLVDNDQGYGLINLASALKPSQSRKLRCRTSVLG